MSVNSTQSLLSVEGLTKIFGALKANDCVDFDIVPGEIHALLGENGAGKSTLVKMLYGSLQPDGGTIRWQGVPVRIESPSAARQLGIGMVFQHFSLFEPLSAAENIALAIDDAGSLAEITAKASALGDSYGLPVNPNALIGDLSVGQRQRIEIIRCLMQNPKLIILDEPTSVLTPQEADRLFETLNKLRAQGTSILYISHKLEEVRALCDRATVLRHGKVVGHCIPAQETASSLAAMMVGAEIGTVARQQRAVSTTQADEPALRVNNLSQAGSGPFSVSLERISLEVWPGEVVGIAGVAGNGQSEFFEALSGERLQTDAANTIAICGSKAGMLGPNQRRNLGAAFAPEERFGHAAIQTMSLADNILLSRHASDKSRYLGGLSVIKSSALRATLSKIVEAMDVRKSGDNPDASTLSGGNLQKLIMGREFDRNPKLLIVDQPTWGVDAGAAVRIRQGMVDLARGGAGVLVISQDLDELLTMCDRIAVMHEGHLTQSLAGKEMTRDAIGLLMGGMMAKSAPSQAVAS
ncbi:MAG: ABC transporter ATP-binding protein [Ahrensia sp.]